MVLKKFDFFFIKVYAYFFLFKFINFYLYFFFYRNYYFFFKFFYFNVKLNYFFNYLNSYGSVYFFKYYLYKFIFSFFFFEFFLDGLYYRVKYYRRFNILGFILGYNHYILFKLPDAIRACVHMKKRRFFVYSANLHLLGQVSNELVHLKYPNLFKGKGLKVLFMNYRKKLLIKKQK